MLLDLGIHRIKLFILIVLIIRALLSVRVQGIIFRDGPSSFFFSHFAIKDWKWKVLIGRSDISGL